jgi:hypothetical protein
MTTMWMMYKTTASLGEYNLGPTCQVVRIICAESVDRQTITEGLVQRHNQIVVPTNVVMDSPARRL